MKAVELAMLIPECCSEVLEAMYFTAVIGAISAASAPQPAPQLASSDDQALAFSLRFTGDISGCFGLRLHNGTARALAANFLGEDPSDISASDLSEVTGELANMLCGSLMSRVEGKHKFVLSHPEPSHLSSCSNSANTLVSTLDTDSGEVLVWVMIEGAP